MVKARFFRSCFIAVGAFLFLCLPSSFARKTNNPVYEDPFDIAAGGASLTKASQAGAIFSNPATLPYGDRFHRWAGVEVNPIVGKDSVEFAQNASQGGNSEPAEMIDTIFKTPIHFGYAASASYLTRNGGFAVISRLEPDLRARKFGENGIPEIRFRAESYHGVGVSLAKLTLGDFAALGVTGKYLYVGEPDIPIEISDVEALKSVTNTDSLKDQVKHNIGFGTDLGLLAGYHGNSVDYRLAAKVDDLGSTRLAGDGATKEFKQTMAAGLGITFHSSTDALHLAVDYRDITNAYEEEFFKKIYTGAKVTLLTYLGLAAGYYQGFPSYGAEIDLIFARIGFTSYTREFGDHPGVDSRSMYIASLALGF